MSEQKYKIMPGLQGHKKMIWDVLATPVSQQHRPKTLQDLYRIFDGKIPNGSIRRNLAELKRDGYVVKSPMVEKLGVRGKAVWSRNT